MPPPAAAGKEPRETPIPMPPVAGCAVVLLKEDGTHVFQQFAGSDQDFEAFLALMRVYEWKRAQGR